MKITIYDVAKKANVSIATVSKVINNKGRISEQTIDRVKKVMEELNYEPNIIASALMGKQTKTIGLLIPDLANPFFSELAKSIESRGNELEYNLVICNTDYDSEKENRYLKLLKQKQVDGFILASGFEDSQKIEQLMKEDIPIVIVARDFPMFSVNAVALDDFMGGVLAAEHLLNLGHKNLGIVARDLWSNRERKRGFLYKLEQNHIKLNREFEYVYNINHIEAGRELGSKYLLSDDPPTAIFACNDLLAAGVIDKANELGFKVPQDLSVIGFDNTSVATIIRPELTTIAQPIIEMGSEVMDMMISAINKENIGQKRLTLLPELVVRKSTIKTDC